MAVRSLTRSGLLWCAFWLAGAVPSPATAQSTGALHVLVTDPTGAVVNGAAIRVQPTVGGPATRGRANHEGRLAIEAPAPASFLVVAEAPGFAAAAATAEVGPGQTTVVTMVLVPASVREDVVVSATRIATPTSSIPNTITIVPATTLESRASGSGDLASVLESTVPGFAPSLKKMSGRGETLRGRNPLYTINGVPQHTPLRDGERDGHTIDIDFLERVEVIHGASAIQGIGGTGGIVNLVTRSPRSDGEWTHDVKLSMGNADSLEADGWSSKLSYLLGKRVGRVDVVAGFAIQKRGMFFDARGDAIGLYPTQGDIMDSTSRGFYTKAGVQFTAARRLEVAVNDFRLERDGDFVTVSGNRAAGVLTTSAKGDPRPLVGDPAVNDATTVSVDYRDKQWLGGDASIQGYVSRFRGLFEGGAFSTFSLAVGGPAFLDQSAIESARVGAKLTYALNAARPLGLAPTIGLDLSHDASSQVLARTGRTWVPETVFREAAPFLQFQRVVFDKVLLSGGARLELARVEVADFTTLPSSRSTFVRGGQPSFTEVLPNLGVVVPVSNRLSAYGSYSEGFTMPDVGRVLRAVNAPGLDVDTLVDIEPVVASNIEVGVDYRWGPATLHADYYRSVSERGSLLDRDAEGIFHVRRQPTTIDGIDVAATASWRSWTAGGNYAWLRGRYDSDRNGSRDTDLDGLNIAPNRLNLYVETPRERRVSARLQLSSLMPRTFDGLAAPVGRDFGGYATGDLSAALSTRVGLLRLGIENLLDKQYTVYFSQVDSAATNDSYFAGPGRNFTVTLERRF